MRNFLDLLVRMVLWSPFRRSNKPAKAGGRTLQHGGPAPGVARPARSTAGSSRVEREPVEECVALIGPDIRRFLVSLAELDSRESLVVARSAPFHIRSSLEGCQLVEHTDEDTYRWTPKGQIALAIAHTVADRQPDRPVHEQYVVVGSHLTVTETLDLVAKGIDGGTRPFVYAD